jgi:hypothetical protein
MGAQPSLQWGVKPTGHPHRGASVSPPASLLRELLLGCQAIDGRRTSKTPRRDNGVTDRTAQGGGGDERHNGVPIQVMQDIPTRMEEPAEADEPVCVEALVGTRGDDRRERKLPEAQPPIEIGGASAREHDGIEVPPLWFLERGCRADEERGDDDRRCDINRVDRHAWVVPCRPSD